MEKKTLNIEEKAEQFVNRLNKYAEYKDLIGKPFYELKSTIDSFKSDAESAKEKDRLLRIGIIGQIKRGKSSLLNALFFEGEDILPKAITPMTAALTSIRYAEKPKAVVKFYSRKDWDAIVAKAKEYIEIKNSDEGIEPHDDLKAFYEMYEKAKTLGDVEQYLGKEEELSGISSLKELTGELNRYVGAEGKFSPLVKSTELYVNLESLKDIEIIDTPGLNDPVISRSMLTKEYIGKCDVVFLLSSCSQFLPNEDMQLLRQNIPSKGISNILLIGSRFDESLVEAYEKYPNVVDLIQGLRAKFEEEAGSNIQNVANDFGEETPLVKTLRKALPPIFISSMSYNIAQHFDNLSEEEQHTLKLLNNMYNDFEFDRETLYQLANLKPIEEKVEEFKKRKEEILSQRLNEIFRASEKSFNEQLRQIQKTVEREYERFKNEDIETIERKQSEIIKKLNSGKKRIDGIFESNIINIEKSFAELKAELKEEASKAKRLAVRTGSETKTYTIDHGMGFLFWRSLTGNRYETRTTTVHYQYANVHEAIEHLEDFVLDSEREILERMKTIVDVKKLRGEILVNMKDMFDLSDDNFNPSDILIPLENAVNRITIPEYNLDVEKHIETVRNKFNASQVRDDEINSLRREQSRVVGIILSEIQTEISNIINKITDKLVEIKNSFLPELTNDLQETVEKLRKQLEEKETYIIKYESLLKLLNVNL